MNRIHLEQLCKEFRLGENPRAEELQEGTLNRNYLLTTDTGRYFVKSVRERRKADVPYIAAVEMFMHEKGIPAVCMLRNESGKPSVEYDDQVYTLYPFIESVRTHTYDLLDFRRMGKLLGEIHRAGSTDIPAALRERFFTPKSDEDIRARLEAYRARVEHSSSEVDRLFRDYIDLKLTAMNAVGEQHALPMDTLTHGDYHARNLLIDADRTIIGVCDWEQSAMNAGAYELARSLFYICFTGEREDEPHRYELESAVKSAHSFIDGYRSVYPIANEELDAGIGLRLRKLIFSAWIEEQHYDRGDNRSNKFIRHEMRLIQDFSDIEKRIQLHD